MQWVKCRALAILNQLNSGEMIIDLQRWSLEVMSWSLFHSSGHEALSSDITTLKGIHGTGQKNTNEFYNVCMILLHYFKTSLFKMNK